MLQRRVEPFTRSVGRLFDLPAGYSQHERKVKSAKPRSQSAKPGGVERLS
jgi:hypothetical protein